MEEVTVDTIPAYRRYRYPGIVDSSIVLPTASLPQYTRSFKYKNRVLNTKQQTFETISEFFDEWIQCRTMRQLTNAIKQHTTHTKNTQTLKSFFEKKEWFQ